MSEYFIYSILVPAIIGLARYRGVSRDYYPLLFLIWIGVLQEIITEITLKYFRTNALSANIYSAVEITFIFWIFRRVGSLKGKPVLAYSLLASAMLFWVINSFYLSPIAEAYNSYSNIYNALLTVFLSINSVNYILITDKYILQSAPFWIFISFIIFYTYFIIVEFFWLYGLNTSESFQGSVFSILEWVNLFCNLIYGFAILWMRRRQAFTQQF